MTQSDPQPDRRTVVEDVNRKSRQANLFSELIDDPSQVVERIWKTLASGHIRLPETRKIGCDQPEAICKAWDQIPKHVACGREPMEEQKRWRLCRTCFAIRDPELGDVTGAISDSCS